MFDIQKTFRAIARTDDQAYEFLLAVYAWLHVLDDLIDRDRPVNLPQVHEVHMKFVQTVAMNPFFQRHCHELLPVFLTSAVAHFDSERFRLRVSVVDRITSQILKSQYQDIFYYVAYLVGGFPHAVEMSRLLREYDFDPAPPPSLSG